jgi:acyl dehydratase
MRNHWVVDFPEVTEEQIRNFAIAAEEPNPIHRDNGAAQQIGLAGIIALNVMIDNFASRAIAAEIPMAKVHDKKVIYENPLYAGSLLQVSCEIPWHKMHLAHVTVTIKNGFETIATCECRLLLPRKTASLAPATESATAIL